MTTRKHQHCSGLRHLHLATMVASAWILATAPEVQAQGGPLVISEVRALAASDGAAGAYFGAAVSVSGSFAAIGAYAASSGKGAVYIYERNQGGADQWGQVRKIAVPDGGTSDHFGFSVSLSGSMLAVGAPDNDEYGSDAGLVYIFERNQGGADQWGLLCKVASSDLSAGDHFGYSVSLDLNLLAVGAHGELPNGVSSGAAYVFHMNHSSSWFGQVARLVAGDAAAGDQFGAAVAVSGDRVVVGAPMDDNEHGTDAGGAYLFTRDHGGYNHWGQVRKFTGESEQDHYGRAVAICGATLILGAPDSTEGGAFGRAYVYERNQGGADAWGWVKTLTGATTSGSKFGGAVALSYERAFVGASMERADGPIGAGAVFVYGRDKGGSGNWGRESQLLAADREANDYFGAAVAVDGNVMAIGAHGDNPQGSFSGSARLFRATGNRWYFETKLTNSHPAFPRTEDYFGSSVAYEDGWLAVGAPRLSGSVGSETLGVGAPTVTMFRRRPPGQVNAWGAGQNVIYEDVGDLDCFGASVALSQDQLVVGAPLDPTDGGSPRGMAYAFARNQFGADAWGQVSRMNQHNRHNLEEVGMYVAIEGDTIVLGSSGTYVAESADWSGDLFGIPYPTDPLELFNSIYEMFDFWDSDVIAAGGNTYMYGRDAGGQSRAWDYQRRFPYWEEDEVVALSGNTLAVGIRGVAVEDGNEVRIYGRNYGGEEEWGRIITIEAPAGITRDGGFGGAIALDGDTLAVGPLVPRAQANPSTLPEGESVFIFKRNAGGADAWGLVREIKLGFTLGAVGFGSALALADDVLLVGAVGQSNKAGAVYVFERNVGGADKWGRVHQFTVPEPWPDMWFGHSVALDNNVVAIGAPGNDVTKISATASIVYPVAGAVYVFSRGNNRAPVMANTPGTGSFSVNEDTAPGWISAYKVSVLVQRAQVTDADGDSCGIAVVAANNTGGQWQYSTDGSSWKDLQLDTADTARVLDAKALIRFVPAPNFSGSIKPGITFRAWDQTFWDAGGLAYTSEVGGRSCFSQETEILNCDVSPINDRPVLGPAAGPRLPDIYGNILSQYNRGILVSNLVQGLISDVDGNLCGIAVGSVINTHGQWEYSVDGGVIWRPLAGVQPASARLLGPGARVRFMPAQNYSGMVANGLGFVAWDQSSGSSGGLGSIQSGTAFSTQTSAASITVTPVVNHAPVLDLFGNPAFQTISRNATANAGTAVADLLQDWVEDVDGDECGIALAQVDSTPGNWQFSVDDGASWTNVGTVSFNASLLLGPEARLRLVPGLNYTGMVLVAVMYRAWDQTSGSEGSKVNTSVNGGDTAFSIGIEPAPITVSGGANQAPVLASPALPFLTTIQEGETNSAGDSVGNLLGSLASDADGQVCGMAIYRQDTNHGVWQVVLSKFAPWVPLGNVSSTAARLLTPTARVRFVPAAGYSGTVSSGLSFRAWDRSTGTNGSTASVASNGGSTPYSTGTGQAGITVAAVNSAPVLSASSGLAFTPTLENSGGNSGNTASNLIARAVSDADGDTCGIAIFELNTEHGFWQYWSTNGHGGWVTLPEPRAPFARLVGPNVRLRFVPDVDFHGTITNAMRLCAWDQTKGTDGGLVLITDTGGQTAYSRTTRWASQTVNEANRAPTEIVLDNARMFENRPVGFVVGHLSATDPNASDAHTFTLVAGEGGEDNAAFVIQSNRLQTATVLDRETQAEYAIRIQARDSGGRTLETAFVVTLDDLPDTAPSDLLLSPAIVAENEPTGTVVGQLTAVDPDLGETLAFALVAGEGDADNGSFSIQGNSLVTTGPLDFETKQYCTVRVQVEDGHNPPLAQPLAITVMNVAENVAPRDLTMTCTCLLPGSPAGTTVGIVRFLDSNPGGQHTVSLVAGPGDADNAKFQLQARALLTTAPLDFGVQPKYQVRIQVEDTAGEIAQQAFEIVPAVPIWQENFESGLGAWTHAAEEGQDTWRLSTEAARSPTQSLSATGTASLSDASAVSPWIPIPTNAGQIRLDFHHQYNWAPHPTNRLDAGVLECRRQGEAWQDVWSGELGNFFLAGAYRGAMSPTNVHPLSARPVWSGNTSNNFVPVALALDAGELAGQNVQFRWRQGTTSGLTTPRWHLDDVRLGVVAPAGPSVARMTPCVLVGDDLELTWSSVPDQPYVIEATSGLSAPWSPVTGNVAGQTNATRTTIRLRLPDLPGYPQKALFFRVRSP